MTYGPLKGTDHPEFNIDPKLSLVLYPYHEKVVNWKHRLPQCCEAMAEQPKGLACAAEVGPRKSTFGSCSYAEQQGFVDGWIERRRGEA